MTEIEDQLIKACIEAEVNYELCEIADIAEHQAFGTYQVTDLDKPLPILDYLNRTRQTLFYVSGVEGNITSTSVTTVMDAYKDQYNRVYLDWSEEAQVLLGLVPVSYVAYDVPNAEQIGYRFRLALVTLMKDGNLEISEFFLMGHSLGAQLVGLAGKCTKEKGYTLARIIGLDPAGPAYTKVAIAPGLDKTSATCVICIHTDPDGLGGPKALGYIDFYPNYNKDYTMQPGCTVKANPLVLNNETTCSHDLAWKLACVVVKVPGILIAEYAVSGDAWLAGQGDPSNIANITLYCTPGATGTYYFRTVAAYPYGLGLEGIYPQ